MEEPCSAAADLPSLPDMPLLPPEALLDRLENGRVAVRRAVLRRRRSLSALLAGLAVLAGLAALAPSEAPTVAVVVAARDLPSGAVLGPGDVERVALPVPRVPEGAVDDVDGSTLAGPLRRGEPVTDVRLVGPGLAAAHPDRAVVPIRIPDAAVVALLRVGDRVDVMASDPAEAGARAEVIASGATVLALPGTQGGTASSHGAGAANGALVVLAVEREAATRLLGSAARELLSLTISR